MIKSMSKHGATLGVFAIACTAIVAIVAALTAPIIAKQEAKKLLSTMEQLLPSDSYDNDLFNSCFLSQDTHLLGSELAQKTWIATREGQPVGLAIETVAPDGYSGNILLLVALHYDGSIAGVRVLNHKETPGLGDKIDLHKSDWITRFNGLMVDNEKDPRWAVKKDGGDFDAFTGATITPRAVVKAVKRAVLYYQQHQATLYQQAANCES
ncbi:electron transport complex subunit RsxG [Motilimonas pumila]|uniref:Ion-translocating oxidoreductase complex subunit G n=1 Tax=Motilimonas pumila TaxID=2303987 RepID=A0A418YFE5_9GAMM|nr:electron transport complex subunit RsxG [Motilimonas pumila]RJG48103.1 electron transport complex subunit RsxG [Motilimonas pumila]